jgi:transposase
MLLAERQAYGAKVRDQALLIEKLEHQIAQLRQERFGQSSEPRALLDQLELQLFELKEDQAQAEVATPIDESPSQAVQAFTRRKPARRPLPGHLPRERVVHPAPSSCQCCGGVLHKLGEDRVKDKIDFGLTVDVTDGFGLHKHRGSFASCALRAGSGPSQYFKN